MKLNIVRGLYIVLRPNTNSRKIPGFHRGGGGVQSQDTILDYCDIIYHTPSVNGSLNTLMEKVERVQCQAGLAITGAWQGSNRNVLYENMGWESLSDRRTTRRVLQLYKVRANQTPFYLTEKLTPLRGLLHLNINPRTFRDIPCKTNRYKNSFFPNAVNSWNNIVSSFQNSIKIHITFGKLKSHMSCLFRPFPKSIFNIHDPKGLKYIFQLRMKSSPLKSHKKRYNFADTPTDICECNQGVENICHFLFECLRFVPHRVNLAISIIERLNKNNTIHNNEIANNLNLYLYGHPSLNIAENKCILQATIQYIKSTHRFSPE